MAEDLTVLFCAICVAVCGAFGCSWVLSKIDADRRYKDRLKRSYYENKREGPPK